MTDITEVKNLTQPEITDISNNNQHELSDNLEVITGEVLSFIKNIQNSFIEIGRRLKHVRGAISEGSYTKWLKINFDMHPSTASRYIKAFEQFGNIATSQSLGSGKIFEMLALPEYIDRGEFIEGEYIIPSTGEKKAVEQMTVKELREVVKPLKEAEKQKKLAEKGEASQDNINLTDRQQEKQELVEPSIVNEQPDNVLVESKNDINGDIASVVAKFSEEAHRLVERYDSLPSRLQVMNVCSNGKELEDAINMLRSFTARMLTVHNMPAWSKSPLDEHLHSGSPEH